MNDAMEPRERARKNLSIVLNAMAEKGQNELAKAMGVAESTISRMKGEGGLEQVVGALAHLGLKVVPVGYECYDPEYVAALRTLANVGIKKEAPRLDWSDAV
jgi:hypothetical protein